MIAELLGRMIESERGWAAARRTPAVVRRRPLEKASVDCVALDLTLVLLPPDTIIGGSSWESMGSSKEGDKIVPEKPTLAA